MRRLFSGLFAICITVAVSAALARAFTPQETQPQPPERGQGRGPQGQGEMLMGTLASVGVDRIEIKRQDGTSQVVMVNDQTQYRQGQQDIQMEDLKPGDRIIARGQTNDKKEFVATAVRRVTDDEMQRFQGGGDRVGGAIAAIDGNQIKIQNPRQGESIVFVNDQTTFMKDRQPITLKDLKVGDRIFAVGKVTDGKFVATRVMSGQFQRGGMGRPNQNPDQEKQ